MKRNKMYSKIALGLLGVTLSAQAQNNPQAEKSSEQTIAATVVAAVEKNEKKPAADKIIQAGALTIQSDAAKLDGDCTLTGTMILKEAAPSRIIGVALDILSPEIRAKHPDLKPAAGLQVMHVIKGSPADEAGLKKDDILVSWNGDSLVHPAQLRVLVNSAEINVDCPVVYLRAGKENQVTVKVKEAKLGDLSASKVMTSQGGVLTLGGNDGAKVKGGLIEGNAVPLDAAMIEGIIKKMRADGVDEKTIESMDARLKKSKNTGSANLSITSGVFTVGPNGDVSADIDKAKIDNADTDEE